MKTDGYTFWREKLGAPKFVVAPMVDQSELAWRMLSRRYGAQLCYTPMMHAAVFARDPTYRAENFVTCPEDRPLIAQFCSDDPDMFLKAAKIIENECDAIDLNLGCPQNIAKRGHYGAFLQDEWDLISKMLSNVVDNLKIPVTAKIRVFEDIDKSVEYAKMIERTGVAMLAVHGRTREQKGARTGLASWKHIKAIKDAVKIPVFANGNILSFNDVLECMKQTGCDGVMIAEPNLYNPALFAGLNPNAWEMAREYVELVRQYPCSFTFIRGHLFKMFHKIFERHVDSRDKLAKIKDIDQLEPVFDEIMNLCLQDKEKLDELAQDEKESPESVSMPYWVCQPYIRPDPDLATTQRDDLKRELESKLDQINMSTSEDTSSSVPSISISIKRQIHELTSELEVNQEPDDKTKKMVKLLERKRRKLEKCERKQRQLEQLIEREKGSENGEDGQSDKTTSDDRLRIQQLILNNKKPTKYVLCSNCKNPRGENCSFSLCRSCCKEKVFADQVDCKGHGLKFRVKTAAPGPVQPEPIDAK